ncbi:MAG: hypothetical protein V3U02_00505 [Calditrichia bacterium]|jgi:hypothetical protein
MKHSSFFIILIFIISACTSNPFFGDDAARDKHIVKGKVLLEYGDSTEDIYIWLENLNISTRTNAQGDFKLELPRTDDLSGYNNDLKLYYYVGNYAIQHSNLLVVDGIFEFGKYDINNDGFIKETVYLKKLIDITTTIRPEAMPRDYNGSVDVEVKIINLDTNLLVINRMTREGVLSGYIFREINSPSTSAKIIDFSSVFYRGYRLYNPVTWTGSFVWEKNFLLSGTYEVYPYIFLRQEDIPQELLESFGTKADQLTDAYLKIPFKHNSDILTIN